MTALIIDFLISNPSTSYTAGAIRRLAGIYASIRRIERVLESLEDRGIVSRDGRNHRGYLCWRVTETYHLGPMGRA